MIDLLENNAGCELPCWWGFTPGETSSDSIYNYFSPLGIAIGSNVGVLGTNVLWVNVHVWQNNFHMGASFFLDKDVVKVIITGAHISEGDYLIFNNPTYNRYMGRYILPRILSTLGQPAEVLVTAALGSTGGTVPDYEIVLFYPENGIMVSYKGLREENTDFYRLCPNETLIDLWLWSPHEKMEIADIYLYGVSEVRLDEQKGYFESFLPLKQATGMDIGSFYSLFLSNTEKRCLDTPAHLWKKRR